MPLQGKKVFVIEHSSFILAQITSVLAKEGVDVKSSQNPSRALLDIVHWHPDAIISSVDIGEISGFDLCLLVRMMPEYSAIPFVILSSNESEQVKLQMSTVGADYYVPKDRNIAANIQKTISQAFHEAVDIQQAAQSRQSQGGGDHILVVDDSVVMRRIVCNMLGSLGVDRIVQAQHGKDALKKLDEYSFAMVLTDWNMPIMNGLELTKAIRGRYDVRDIPIVMITTEGAQAEREEAEQAGVNELLPKPFKRDQFQQVLQKFLGSGL